MTTAAWVGLTAFGALALTDWVAVARGHRPAEYVCKPASLAVLTVTAMVLDPTNEAQRVWFVVALALSLAGDVFLMLPRDRFVAGLGSFLVAHVAYVIGLSQTDPSVVALGVGAVGVSVVAVPLGHRVIQGARDRDHRLVVPVGLYITVISVMVATALATGNAWAMAGALLFYGSDALIGWSRFVGPLARSRLAIMVTYHLGQAGLVVSLMS